MCTTAGTETQVDTYQSVAKLYSRKWKEKHLDAALKDTLQEIQRETAHRQSNRRRRALKRTHQILRHKKQKEEATRRKFILERGAVIRDIGGREVRSLKTKSNKQVFRWDSIYAPRWTDPNTPPPPTAYKEFKIKYDRIINHEEELAQKGEPVVARKFPKIVSPPPAFGGVIDLNWHAGVKKAILATERRAKNTAFEMRKNKMTPSERMEARKLKFGLSLPNLSGVTQRYAAAHFASLQKRKCTNIDRISKNDETQLTETQTKQETPHRENSILTGAFDVENSITNSTEAEQLNIEENNKTGQKEISSSASIKIRSRVEESSEEIVHAEELFFHDRHSLLHGTCDQEMIAANQEEFTQVSDDVTHEKIFQHREIVLNKIAREWSKLMVAKMLRIDTIYDKYEAKLALDGLDAVDRLDQKLPPFEHLVRRSQYERLRRMGFDLLGKSRNFKR